MDANDPERGGGDYRKSPHQALQNFTVLATQKPDLQKGLASLDANPLHGTVGCIHLVTMSR